MTYMLAVHRPQFLINVELPHKKTAVNFVNMGTVSLIFHEVMLRVAAIFTLCEKLWTVCACLNV